MGVGLSLLLGMRRRAVLVRVALCVLLALVSVGALDSLLVVLAGRARAQAAGATLTVLRGTAGVLKADGLPVAPAASGMVLGEGDRVATVGRSAVLVTLFEGSEIELGADTTIILKDLDAQARRTTIGIEAVLGTTVHRVVTLVDPSSSYRVEAGGSVALVRGTVFGHHVDGSGDITLAVGNGEMEFPRPGMMLRRGEKRTETSRGDIVDSRFDPTTSLFTTVTEPASSGNPSGTENPGLGTGSSVVPQQSAPSQRGQEEGNTKPHAVAGRTFLTVAAPSGTVRLEVDSIDGFAAGDVIRIGTGPRAEVGTIAGFGSILLHSPLSGSFDAGTVVERLRAGPGAVTPTGTAGAVGTPVSSPTPTVTPTGTVGSIGTAVPTPTPTASATATAAATPHPVLTGTPTATATAAATATSTATATATPTSTATATVTSTATATATSTPVFPCLGPLARELASGGGGVAGATRQAVSGGVSLDVYVGLERAAPSTTFDVWVDIEGGSAGNHWPVGSFTTDRDGNATYRDTVIVPFIGANIDVEVIHGGDLPGRHQYIRLQFVPCVAS